MKTNFLKRAATLLLSAGLILTTACSDDVPGGENGGDDNSQYEKGYIALSVINASAKSALSKAAVTTPVDEGTTNEKKVNKILLVLYSGNTDDGFFVDYQYNLDPANDLVSATHPTYQSKAKEVAVKAYKLAVFVNPPAAIVTATAEKSNLTTITAAKDFSSKGVVDLIEGTTENTYDNFLMSNMEGLVDVAATDIKSTPEAAVANPVKLYVERAVAKLSIARAANEEFKTTLNATIGEIKWDVDVVNKSTYWMRKQAKMLEWNSTNNQTTGSLIDEVAYDNTKDDRVLRYAEDPNFTGYSLAYWNSKGNDEKPYDKPANPNTKFTYLTDATTTLPISPAAAAVVYMPENTMAATDQWEDVTTSVVFKTLITPARTALNENTKPGTVYYVYKGLVFTLGELKEIFDDASAESKSVNIGGTGKTWAALVTANSLLAGLQEELVTNKATLSGSGENYTNTPAASVKAGNIKFFIDGLNYYNVPIRHYSNELQPTNMGYGRFGVVRNNVYQLTLNSINNFGDIKIPEKTNPDETESWLSVVFTILPWVERSSGIDL